MTLSYPTIVVCVERAALAVAERLADMLRGASSLQSVSVWGMFNDNGSLAVSRVWGMDAGATHTDEAVRTDSVANAVFDVIAEVLSLHKSRLPNRLGGPIGLRLTLVGAAWEIAPTMASDIANAFHAGARSHCASRYLTDACFLLPIFMPESCEAGGTLQAWAEVLDGVESSEEVTTSLADSFTYYWWLGPINASGLTLPRVPTSAGDIATVIHGIVSITPEQLPRTLTMVSGQPQFMSAGYAELFVSREDVLKYFIARSACGIIDHLFLSHRGSFDRHAVRRR